MEWWLALVIILGGLLALMVTGLPIAFCFMLVNMVGVHLLWGGQKGFYMLILNIKASVMSFALLPMILFILMGAVLFHSGFAPYMIDAINKWLGRLPGRLSLLAVAVGTIFAALSGSSMGSTAMLGGVLLPEMEKHGYKRSMSLGPVMGSGGLAVMIPPSSLGVFIAVMAQVSVGHLLIAIIVPGLIMAVIYASYIFLRCKLDPSIAPSYNVKPLPLSEKIWYTVKYVLPLTFIMFLVTGIVFLGVATPSEAAATGTIGCFFLAAVYKGLHWEVVKRSMESTLRSVAMILIIVVSATAFSQVLAFSGATRGMIQYVLSVPYPPIVVLIGMMLIGLLLGCFMDASSVIMITIPMFMPVVKALGFNPVWFATMMLLNIETGQITPPFGTVLFVAKAISPPDTTMTDVYKAGVPFVGWNILVLALIMAFPALALWLPSLMR